MAISNAVQPPPPSQSIDVSDILATIQGVADLVGVGELLNPAHHGEPYPAGQRFSLLGRVENRLAPGRYFVHVGVTSASGISTYAENAASFVVFGGPKTNGVFSPMLHFEVESDRSDA